MDKFDLKKYLAEGKLFEKKTIPNFKTGWDIINYFDEIHEFKIYRNENASYDDQYYIIPTDIFFKITGWSESDVEDINNNLSQYEGSIYWSNTNPNQHQENTVVISGGA